MPNDTLTDGTRANDKHMMDAMRANEMIFIACNSI